MKKRLIISILTLLLMGPVFNEAKAAEGFTGYAVYRDGVAVIEWHSGLMTLPYYDGNSNGYGAPVTHARGRGHLVSYGTWDIFMESKDHNFKGVYKPKKTASSINRDLFESMARKLVTENIEYTVLRQVSFDYNTSDTWVYTDDIWAMRCDGVIEYVYEWYGFRVFGSDANWDVTKNTKAAFDQHSFASITPKTQAQNYLAREQVGIPKK